MDRTIRNKVAAVLAAFLPVSFILHMCLFFQLLGIRPDQPHPEIGLVYPLNNHGSYHYVTGTEATELNLLFNGFLIAFLALLIVVPKDHILPPANTPRWLSYISFSYKTDLENPNPELTRLLLTAAAAWCAIILLAGPLLVRWLVTRGVILSAA